MGIEHLHSRHIVNVKTMWSTKLSIKFNEFNQTNVPTNYYLIII